MSEKNFVSYGSAETVLTEFANDIKKKARIFPGTQAEWNALPLSEKIKYDYAAITDDGDSGVVANVVEQDNANPVSSGAVYTYGGTKQPKTLETALTIGGASRTTVEGALGALNEVVPSEANASNQLVTANEAELSTMPLAKFQIGSGGAIGYADLGVTTTTISQAFSWLEVEYGRVDGFIDKYFISVAGASSNTNYIKVVRLTDYGQAPTITLDANKHIWMSMDTYVYIRVKAYGNFSISGTLSRTAPTGTTIPINRLVTENEINPTLTATFTAGAGVKSGGVTVQMCKKIGDGLAAVTGYINKNTVLTVNDAQSNIGRLGITGHTSLGTNPTSLFLWSQGVTPYCVSSVWKTTDGWIAVPWENGDITLSEDAWFNAIVRYH